MKNIELVAHTFQTLKELDVQEIIVCAGARNAPLVVALEDTDFAYRSYFEERSAGFYALGRIQATRKPVAVLTTSGTAVAELLSAVIESFYQGLPLIIISADRPKSYRGSGAPQSIEHVGIFSQYVQSCQDWDIYTQDFHFEFDPQKPLHLNICFDEPLLDGRLSEILVSTEKKIKIKNKATNINAALLEKPFAILGHIDDSEKKTVIDFLKTHRIPHYAEFLSGLRNHPDLASFQIQSSDQFVKKLFQNKIFNSVIRIGGVPTLRLWRDLEFELKNIPVVSFSKNLFKGLSRKSEIYSLTALKELQFPQNTAESAALKIEKLDEKSTESFLVEDKELLKTKKQLCLDYPNSEPSLLGQLANQVVLKAAYVGNSLPIRLWDGFHTTYQSDLKFYANRGANGIDGQVSTYLGWAKDFTESWCIVGDLTALYDLAALGLIADSDNYKKRIVVMNNNGGQIFNRLFGEKKFLNAQNVSFKAWADLWGWDFIQIKNVEDLKNLIQTTSADKNSSVTNSSTRLIIEVVPDPEQTQIFWQKWDQLWK